VCHTPYLCPLPSERLIVISVCEYVESYRIMEYKSDEWGRKIENQNAETTSIALQVSCRYTQLKEDDTVYSVAQRLSHSVEYMLNHTDIRQPVCHQEAYDDCAYVKRN